MKSINSIDDCINQNSEVAAIIGNYKKKLSYLKYSKKTGDIEIETYARKEFLLADEKIRGLLNDKNISPYNKERVLNNIHS